MQHGIRTNKRLSCETAKGGGAKRLLRKGIYVAGLVRRIADKELAGGQQQKGGRTDRSRRCWLWKDTTPAGENYVDSLRAVAKQTPKDPAAAHNLEESPPPKADAGDFSDGEDPSASSPSNAKTPQRNVCTPELARETPRFPSTAAHPTRRNTQDHPPPRAGLVRRISPGQRSPVPANNPIRTRSC